MSKDFACKDNDGIVCPKLARECFSVLIAERIAACNGGTVVE